MNLGCPPSTTDECNYDLPGSRNQLYVNPGSMMGWERVILCA